MNNKFTAGLVQMRSGRTPDANIAVAESLIREAAAEGADYVLTPEMTNILDRSANRVMGAAQIEQEDPALARFRPSQESTVGLVTHANSITLTPGTVTVEARHGEFLVHALTREGADGLAGSDMDRRVRRFEGGR